MTATSACIAASSRSIRATSALEGALGGGGELGGGEDRPEEQHEGGESGRGLDPGTDPDPAQGLAVMEENVARLEHRAEHSEEPRIVGLSQHNLFPDWPPRTGRGHAQARGRKHKIQGVSAPSMTSGKCPLRDV